MIKRSSRRSLDSILLVFALAFSLVPALEISRAQEPSPSPTPATQTINKAYLHQVLLDLTNAFTVMCVAAHPDDEDGTTLTVLRRKYGVHTVSLFSTFGEGGQNAVGPDLYEELGVIRTQETVKASKIQGSEPHFLGLKDFGFSKSADEAFKFWNHDEALRRMVLKIRELRPDVIITNHDTSRGHGHHQATGQLIIEAFDAAADPKRFPEQLTQFKTWQTQRLFVRAFGGTTVPQQDATTGLTKTFAIDPNEVDPVRGTSFAEQALAALQEHASQGPWPKSVAELMKARGITAGKLPPIRYRLTREAKGAGELPENSTTPLAGLEAETADATPEKIFTPKLDGRQLTEHVKQPDRVLASLIDWRASQSPTGMNAVGAHRVTLMDERISKAIATASGVSVSLDSSTPALVPGTNTTFSIGITNASARPLQVNAVRFHGWGEDVQLKAADNLLPDTETTVTVDWATPKNASFTVPSAEHLYDGLFVGQRFEAIADLEIDGAKFSLRTELRRDIAPAVEIKGIVPSPYVWTPATRNQPLSFKITITNHLDAPFKGNLALGSRKTHRFVTGNKLSLAPLETREVTFKSNAMPFAAPARRRQNTGSGPGDLALSVESEGSAQTLTERPIRMVYSDARVTRDLRVGFVPSFDETLRKSLAALGVNAKQLGVEDVKKGDLSAYQTIIIDNRGYEAHPELIAANSRLLEFVNAGGTLVVFYHKDNEWNPDAKKNRPQLAPYPITLGGERVTVETAPIRFTQPRHALLNFPNRITQADFSDWVQERGLYYPKTWDANYSALFTTNDPGEKPLDGGLLVAQYGKGNYIYTSMVWYRQLRAGQPGAFRMFANMISYGQK